MLINFNSGELLSQPIFFGDSLGIQRYDIQKYPIFEKLNDKQLSYFWQPHEINLSKDRADFTILSEKEKNIFISNLKYQSLLDTVQSRGPGLLRKYTSLPEVESFIITWEFFENIHSKSYTYIIRNLFPNPSEVFDSITKDKNIIKRAIKTIESYEKIDESKEITEEDILRTLINVNILEGIRFYVSFLCSFYFTEYKKVMEGNTKIITLVQRDEFLHLQFTQSLIKILVKDYDNFRKIFEKMKDEIVELYKEAVQQEKEWATYLFEDYDQKLMLDIFGYIEYICDNRLSNLGLPKVYGTKNTMLWADKYMNGKWLQVAPQETEITSYVISGINKNKKISKKYEI
ncbi:MAG: ribonucleotide-diphosphate reductase subunit beta [candidate division WOR-3 bacterium]